MVPTFNELLLPILTRASEKTWTMKDLALQVANDLKLTADDLSQTVPSGKSLISDRIGWAKTYLKKAGLVDQPKYGEVTISARGTSFLATKPSVLNLAMLKEFPGFLAYFNPAPSKNGTTDLTPSVLSSVGTATPDDMIVQALDALHASLKDALFLRVMDGTPAFFERLVINLLLKMGYGSSDANAGKHLGKSGDGGLDGLISEDQLGLDRIYLQAKRYKPENKVGPEAVQAFLGALVNRNATKGVFITTSSFSSAAVVASHNTNQYRMVLIDGDALMNLLIKHEVGVRTATAVAIKRIDNDYFDTSDAG